MDLIFDDDTAVVGLVDNQLVGRLKRDVVAIAPELGHQIGAPLDNARPTSDVVENLVDDVISDDVEEVLALNEVAYRPSNQLEVRGWQPRRQSISDSASWTLHGLGKSLRKGELYKYILEASFRSNTLEQPTPDAGCAKHASALGGGRMISFAWETRSSLISCGYPTISPIGTNAKCQKSEAAKAVVRRNTEEVQGGGNFDVFEELFADDFLDHTPQPGRTPDKAGARELYRVLRAAFPDFHADIHWQIADGDRVTTYKTYHGTHRGEFLGVPPTGRKIQFETVDVMRVRNGKIAEHWGVANLFSLLQQLGAWPAK